MQDKGRLRMCAARRRTTCEQAFGGGARGEQTLGRWGGNSPAGCVPRLKVIHCLSLQSTDGYANEHQGQAGVRGIDHRERCGAHMSVALLREQLLQLSR